MSRRKLALVVLAVLAAVVLGARTLRDERLRRDGHRVLLPLAGAGTGSPVLLGGELRLRYRQPGGLLAEATHRSGAEGLVVVVVDPRTAQGAVQGLKDDPRELGQRELLLRYRLRGSGLAFGPRHLRVPAAERARFAAAEFGELAVAEDGRALLVGLRDREHLPLGLPGYGSPPSADEPTTGDRDSNEIRSDSRPQPNSHE